MSVRLRRTGAGFTCFLPPSVAILALSLSAACGGRAVAPVCQPTAAFTLGVLPTAAVSGGASTSPSASSESMAPAPPPYTLEQLLRVRRASVPRWVPGTPSDIVYLADTGTTPQLFLRAANATPSSATVRPAARALTALPDRVADYRPAPDGSGLLFLSDHDGNENYQIGWVDLRAPDPLAAVTMVTSAPTVRHSLPVLDDNAKTLVFTSTARNGKDFDLYAMPWPKAASAKATGEPAARRPIVELSGSFEVADVRGRLAVLVQSRSNVDNDLWLIHLDRRSKRLLTKHEGDSRWQRPHFSRDGKRLLVLTDEGREHVALVALDLSNGRRTILVDTPHDITELSVARPAARSGMSTKAKDGKDSTDLVQYAVDVDGVEKVSVAWVDPGDAGHEPKVVRTLTTKASGVALGLDVAQDRDQALVALETATEPSEVFTVDLTTGDTTRQTETDHAGVEPSALIPAELRTYETYDRRVIHYFWYARPLPVGQRRAVVVSVHGGPEAHAQPSFSALTQYLALAGLAVAVPNVRGSTGFGKAFTHLDDKEKREDSVRDLDYLAAELGRLPDVDPHAIGLVGASYGGYMVLAGLTLFPERWAVGVSIVGIANFRTFLEQTAPYRRALREAEYGSLEHDGALLDAISPIHKMDRVRAPLMLIHGTKDPRVPIGEARQVAAALEKRGQAAPLLAFEDEGHGLSRLPNRLIAYPQMMAFLRRHLSPHTGASH